MAGGTVAQLAFTTTNVLGSSILLDGHYRIRVKAVEVADTQGNLLSSESDTTFAFKNADFNGDLTVNFEDLLLLARNFSKAARTFELGDANHDGLVNFDDLFAVAQLYGTGLFGQLPMQSKGKSRGGSNLLA